MEPSRETRLALLEVEQLRMRKQLDDANLPSMQNDVTTLKKIVYGFVGALLMSVAAAMIALVLK